MKYSTTIILAVVSLLLLSGCVPAVKRVNWAQKHVDAGHYTYNADRSMALNVAVASGLSECNGNDCKPLRDVPRSKLPASLQNKSNADLTDAVFDSLRVGVGAGQMAGVVNVVTGVGNIAGGLLTLGNLFTGPVDLDDPATRMTMIAWMPKNMATSKEDAKAVMGDMLHKALVPAVIDGYHFTTADFAPGIFGLKITNQHECKTDRCELEVTNAVPSAVTRAPSYVQSVSGPAWAWESLQRTRHNNGGYAIYFGFWKPGNNKKPFENPKAIASYIAKVSGNLPKWVYIYMPPGIGGDYPVMFNQGKPLLFIEPAQQEKEQQTAAL